MRYTCVLMLSLAALLGSCKKFLAAKPDATVAIPSGIADMQALLDNYALMNGSYPSALEIVSDNYYVSSENWSALSQRTDPDLYIWAFNDQTGGHYSGPYEAILRANLVLAELSGSGPEARAGADWRTAMGSAYFFRAQYYFGLSQLFAAPCGSGADDDPNGLVLRADPDFNKVSNRATVGETYGAILSDFHQAKALLPEQVPYKSRPSRAAAYGALARVHLVMSNYDSAGYYAQASLNLHDSLLNYSTISASASAPFPRFNREVIFQLRSSAPSILTNSRARIDSNLYASYATDDLRRTLYFRTASGGGYQFKGDYDGRGTSSGFVFGGIVTDEQFLILAEAQARSGDTDGAMTTLNKLLVTRWKPGSYQPLSTSGPEEALDIVLRERRKELLMRGTRWSDLRRLQTDPARAVTPERLINGTRYTLPPGSRGYVLALPRQVIELSGVVQNQ